LKKKLFSFTKGKGRGLFNLGESMQILKVIGLGIIFCFFFLSQGKAQNTSISQTIEQVFNK